VKQRNKKSVFFGDLSSVIANRTKTASLKKQQENNTENSGKATMQI